MTDFAMRNLSVLNFARGFTFWAYTSSLSLDAILAPGFFNAADDMLEPGDMVVIRARNGNAIRFVTNSRNGKIALEPGQ